MVIPARNKPSQRTAIFLLTGFVAAIYLIGLVLFTLAAKAQLAAGGLVMIALGSLWIYLLGGAEALTCDRDACRIIKPRFLLTAKSVDQIPLASIAEVRVEEVNVMSHDGPGRTGYQLVLVNKDKGSYSFSIEDSRSRAHAIASRIKAYLKEPGHQSLVVRRVPWGMMAIGVCGIGIGVTLILSAMLGWPDAV